MLTVLGDKLLSCSIQNGLADLCPTMDLVALANTENQVHVFRMNGELVFGVPRKRPEAQVTSLRWKPNGRLLAVGYSDGVILLVNTHTGGIVHTLAASHPKVLPVRHLGWGLSLCNPVATKNRLENAGNDTTLDSLISHGFQGSMVDIPPDLPAELASLDVEAFLPKISILPALSRDKDLFSSRQSLDSLFHAPRKEDQESTDVLIMGTDDGNLSLNVYNTFSLRMLPANHRDRVLYRHASHPYSSTHALLWQSMTESKKRIHFQSIDLIPITDSGRYLSTIASKTTQLQNLLRYFDLAQQQIVSEFKNSQDLPKKFMRNIEEALQESDHCSFVEAAYHLVVTGHCYNTMKEWLVDELGDRGHKRWEKATMSGYETIRQYTHENLMPALQRFNVILSRLRGLSKFQESSVALGLETKEIDQIFETLNCLELLSHCILIYTSRELQQFQIFAVWLKHEIEAQTIDPLSASADELLTKDTVPDYAKILEYIQGPMLSSRLYELLDLQVDEKKLTWNINEEGSALYEHYKADIKKIRNDLPLEKRLPGLQMLLTHLSEQCGMIFAKISASQGRKVRLGDMLLVGEDIDIADTKVLPEDASTSQDMEVYIASVHNSSKFQVSITKLTLSMTNGISSVSDQSVAKIVLPKDSRVVHLKFADEHTLVLIVEDKSTSRVLFLPYRSDSNEKSDVESMGTLHYSAASSLPSNQSHATASGNAQSESLNDFGAYEKLDNITKHTFPSQDHPWRPGHVAINGRVGRRVLCVISKDGNRYVLFDLDSWAENENEDENGEGEDE